MSLNRNYMLFLIRCHWRALLWVVFILFACLSPSQDVPDLSSFFARIPYFDKIVHFGLYFIFTILLISGYRLQYPGEIGKSYLMSGLLAFSLGVGIEFAQAAMHAGRSGDFYDAMANTTGIVMALLLFNPLKKLFPRIL